MPWRTLALFTVVALAASGCATRAEVAQLQAALAAAEARAAEAQAEAVAQRERAQAALQDAQRANTAAAQPNQSQPANVQPANVQPSAWNPSAIVEDWKYPQTQPGSAFFGREDLGPYVVSALAQEDFGKVWNFYAKKCGCPHAYEEHVEQTYTGPNQDGAYCVRSDSCQIVDGKLLKDDLATFTRILPGYALTVTLRKRLNDESGAVFGTDITFVCVKR